MVKAVVFDLDDTLISEKEYIKVDIAISLELLKIDFQWIKIKCLMI